MTKFRALCVVVIPFVALTAVACGGSAPVTPAAPTDAHLAAAGAPPRLSAVHDARVVAQWAAANKWEAAAADGLTVEGTDTVTAVTGVCPNVVITVRGVPVSVDGATVFAPGVTCASLTLGVRVHVTGVLTSTAGVLSVVATNIRIESEAAEVTATVITVTGTCPSLTITLQGTSGVVLTDVATTFSPPAACNTIAAGKSIEAHGTRNAAGQLVATQLEVKDDGRRVSGEGTVGDLSGACPALSFVVLGVRVRTSAATTFENEACGSIRNGTKVAAEGDTQADGSVNATRVRITDQPGGGNHIEGEGTVASLTGSCPVLTMVVEGYSVMTSSTTRFVDGVCADIRQGTKVTVIGSRDGTSVTATTVTIHGANRG